MRLPRGVRAGRARRNGISLRLRKAWNFSPFIFYVCLRVALSPHFFLPSALPLFLEASRQKRPFLSLTRSAFYFSALKEPQVRRLRPFSL